MAKKMATKMGMEFLDILQTARKEALIAQGERKAYEDLLAARKKDENERMKAVTRLHRIAYLAGFDRNTMEWTQNEYEAGFRDYAWKKYWELETSSLKFSIYLGERTDMKRDKYQVSLTLWYTYLSEDPAAIHSGYRSTNYGKDRYGDKVEPKKFAKLEDAEAYVDAWRIKLEADHIGEIEDDRRVYEAVKASGYKYDPYDYTNRPHNWKM